MEDCLANCFLVLGCCAGSEGKLVQAYQRVGMLNTISALSSAPGGKAVVSLASTITTYLMSVYKDDGTLSLSLSLSHTQTILTVSLKINALPLQ